jgi:hypothetical protein
MRTAALALIAAVFGTSWTPARGGAEVTLDREFLAGLVEKAPPAPFQTAGQYRGSARNFRLAAIDPAGRRLVVAFEVAGEFRAPIAGALRRAVTPPAPHTARVVPSAAPTADGAVPQPKPRAAGPLPLDGDDTRGWSGFTLGVRAGVKVEPGGPDGTPRLAVTVDEIQRHELDGVAGVLALVLGHHFDALATQIANGKAAALSAKVNEQVRKKVAAFSEYGVLRAVDYEPDRLVLTFDVTRFQADRIAGYVFPADHPAPGSAPLYRWVRPRLNDHFYTIRPDPPAGHPYYIYETVACHVLEAPAPGTVPLNRWRGPREWFYTSAPDGEGFGRKGYHPETVACHVLAAPAPGTVPLYRFVDAAGLHFYSTHPHAEFIK